MWKDEKRYEENETGYFVYDRTCGKYKHACFSIVAIFGGEWECNWECNWKEAQQGETEGGPPVSCKSPVKEVVSSPLRLRKKLRETEYSRPSLAEIFTYLTRRCAFIFNTGHFSKDVQKSWKER